MNALKKIAASARPASVVGTFAAIFLAGCSALPQPPVRPVLYDLGPGQLGPAAEQPPLPALALADVQSAGPVDGSTAVHYRLASPAVVDLLRQAEVLLGQIGENVALCRNHRMPR